MYLRKLTKLKININISNYNEKLGFPKIGEGHYTKCGFKPYYKN